MRISRKVAVSFLAVALLGGAAAVAQKTRDYRKELREAQSQQHRKRYRECIALCEKMLEYHKESWQVQEVTRVKIECLVLDTQYEGALKALAALAGAYPDDAKLRTAAALRTGDVQRMLKNFDEAVATYRKAADGCAKDQPDQAADAMGRAAQVLCGDLKKPAAGVAQYEQSETRFGPLLPKRAAEAVRAVASTHETQTKDMAKAAAAYQKLTAKYAAV